MSMLFHPTVTLRGTCVAEKASKWTNMRFPITLLYFQEKLTSEWTTKCIDISIYHVIDEILCL